MVVRSRCALQKAPEANHDQIPKSIYSNNLQSFYEGAMRPWNAFVKNAESW